MNYQKKQLKDFIPKTEFVRKLMALREQAILKGMKLITVDEILTEKYALREYFN